MLPQRIDSDNCPISGVEGSSGALHLNCDLPLTCNLAVSVCITFVCVFVCL